MGGMGWQDLTVALLAGGAIAWLLRRRFTRRRPTPFCDDCPACNHFEVDASRAPRHDGGLIQESELFRR